MPRSRAAAVLLVTLGVHSRDCAHWGLASSLVDICRCLLCDVAGGCSADRAAVTFLLSCSGGNLRGAGQHRCAPALSLATC